MRIGLACSFVTKRQQEVNGKYHKKAGELDLEQGTAPGSTGPFRKELNEYGQKGRVIAPVVGAFAEMSPDTYAIAGLISSVLANEHCSFFADKPSEAKGMFTQRLYRHLGLAAHLGWARLLVDRYRDLVEKPSRGPCPYPRGPWWWPPPLRPRRRRRARVRELPQPRPHLLVW